MADDSSPLHKAILRQSADEVPADVPVITRPASYSLPNLVGDALAELVDTDDDGTETYLFGGTRIECAKCAKWTWHDIYVEISGMVDIKASTMAHCRDCGLEQTGEVKSGIGSITPRSIERVAADARRPQTASRSRGKAARRARRNNR